MASTLHSLAESTDTMYAYINSRYGAHTSALFITCFYTYVRNRILRNINCLTINKNVSYEYICDIPIS